MWIPPLEAKEESSERQLKLFHQQQELSKVSLPQSKEVLKAAADVCLSVLFIQLVGELKWGCQGCAAVWALFCRLLWYFACLKRCGGMSWGRFDQKQGRPAGRVHLQVQTPGWLMRKPTGCRLCHPTVSGRVSYFGVLLLYGRFFPFIFKSSSKFRFGWVGMLA